MKRPIGLLYETPCSATHASRDTGGTSRASRRSTSVMNLKRNSRTFKTGSSSLPARRETPPPSSYTHAHSSRIGLLMVDRVNKYMGSLKCAPATLYEPSPLTFKMVHFALLCALRPLPPPLHSFIPVAPVAPVACPHFRTAHKGSEPTSFANPTSL